ncbi:hypothetical protein [Wenxinia saemankumensis]|uniref:Uncharacterized protein n=1 Tax=Wenxinia saemankumensis TaxID=1447782 RepID=A0A1M6H092_9RHOB|nr:hypothetical protein [Wenxinia saemankumensis]SHJ15627.1 hypothetical protein SAMN05444417_3034 [Wenxinia saemankumensis]
MSAPGIGHNNGPTMEGGTGWRRHAWGRARAELLPVLPVEVVRLRVKRAQELGLPYRTYAGFRAATGHDLIGFLFSTNALRPDRAGAPAPDRAAWLSERISTRRVVLAQPAGAADRLAASGVIDAAHPAPGPHAGWAAARAALRAACEGRPADRFVLVGEAPFERPWAEAAGCAGWLDGAACFEGAPAG